MAMVFRYANFVLKLASGTVKKVEKNGSIHNGKLMVVIPFTLYNDHYHSRKFSKEYYSFIIPGQKKKISPMADYGFCDSLINTIAKSRCEVSGYVRIPFSGPGKYGIRIGTSGGQNLKMFVARYDYVEIESAPVNREGDMRFERGNYFPNKVKKTMKPVKQKKIMVKVIPLDRKNFGKPLGAGGRRRFPMPEED